MIQVSLIIPIYNVEAYIEKSLLSALTQTYECIEYIIVDDRGSDNSMNIVRHIIHQDKFLSKKIHIIQHPYNKGVAAARNSGFEIATGDYVFYMDSDDTLPENCIERHVSYIEKYREVDFTTGDINFIGGRRAFKILDKEELVEGPVEILKRYFLKYIHHSPWNKLISSKFLRDNKILFEENLLYEDTLWSFELARYASTIVLVPEKTYNYIVHDNSFTTTYDRAGQRMASRIYILDAIIDYDRSYPYPELHPIISRYITEYRFKILVHLISSDADVFIKRKYYDLLTDSKYRFYDSKGIYAYMLKWPYGLFVCVASFMGSAFLIIKKARRKLIH